MANTKPTEGGNIRDTRRRGAGPGLAAATSSSPARPAYNSIPGAQIAGQMARGTARVPLEYELLMPGAAPKAR